MPECVVLAKKYLRTGGRQEGVQYEAVISWKEEYKELNLSLDELKNIEAYGVSEEDTYQPQKSSTTHYQPVRSLIGSPLEDLLFRLDIVVKAHRILHQGPWDFKVTHYHPKASAHYEVLALDDEEYAKVVETVAKASSEDLRG